MKQDSSIGRLVLNVTVRNMSRKDWDDYFFDIARIVSTRATCPRKQVGCVIVNNKRILATGYNGAPEGSEHCTDVGCAMVANHCTRAIHAEENAINWLLDYFYPAWFTEITLYCTLQPCNKCAKLISKYKNIKVKWLEDNENL